LLLLLLEDPHALPLLLHAGCWGLARPLVLLGP
jgi:hypothetical protein